MLGKNLFLHAADTLNFLGFNDQVWDRATTALCDGCMQYHPAVRQDQSVPVRASSKEQRRGRHNLADACCFKGGVNKLHAIVNCQSRGHGAASGIEVQGNGHVGVVVFQM